MSLASRPAVGALIGPVLFALAWLGPGFLSPGFSMLGDLLKEGVAV